MRAKFQWQFELVVLVLPDKECFLAVVAAEPLMKVNVGFTISLHFPRNLKRETIPAGVEDPIGGFRLLLQE